MDNGDKETPPDYSSSHLFQGKIDFPGGYWTIEGTLGNQLGINIQLSKKVEKTGLPFLHPLSPTCLSGPQPFLQECKDFLPSSHFFLAFNCLRLPWSLGKITFEEELVLVSCLTGKIFTTVSSLSGYSSTKIIERL